MKETLKEPIKHSKNPAISPVYYSTLEERLNIYTHGIGLLLSILALILLVIRASNFGNVWHIVSFSVFGSSLILLYAASTLYHSSKELSLRKRLNILDHASIYILIAGTYTPFTLVTLNGTLGWVLFGITWGIATVGVVLKLFFTGKYNRLSTLAYILMGWVIVFGIKSLLKNLPEPGIYWLFSGGLAYTIGAIFYSIKKIPFNHAIFHLWVLAGSFCHFITVYIYV
jgi:hemolysin III